MLPIVSPEEVTGLDARINKETFSVGETITISGNVDTNIPISIVIVTDPNNMVEIMMVEPVGNTYSQDYITNGNYGVGTFEIRVSQDDINFIPIRYQLTE